ncbi:hypothetical protein JTE90_024631 [Oedothorax gibbosus]|uniref:F-box domain-containing protein n=1 Tax=Oedothorax gibbosus TaxID=931172 RepID=A0AAV6U405_9ARAC|nr:hypothetical protein JTE90_024631 [Oedothorax gibbosus]
MGADINSLPHEVLVRIFQFYLELESQVKFFNYVSNVCRTWKGVSRNRCFFETLDGSLPLSALVTLAKAGSLRLTKTLKFGKVTKDKSGHYKCIYSNMPRLKHIDLTNVCEKLYHRKEHPVFTELDGLCPELCELVLSPPDAHCKSKILGVVFEKMMKIRGPHFVHLDFSSVNIYGLPNIFELVADNCPKIEELLAQNMKGNILLLRFNTGNMQKKCPKLKTLRLGFPITFVRNAYKDPVGFPDLEIFTHPIRDAYFFRSSDLETLLCRSPKLKILDVRGCVPMSFEVLNSLPATDLEQINLSWLNDLNYTGIIKIFQKWSHSLNIVDVSHIKDKAVNEMFSPQHLPNGLPNLEVLNVNNTSITVETLKVIIQQNPKLRYLNLESCHGLIRGTRQIHRSRSEIEKLLVKIEKFEEMDCI